MRHRKGLSIVLTIALILTLGLSTNYAETPTGSGSTGATGTYTDIGGHWAESIIKEAASLGVVGGYPDGTYLPDNLIKREEFFKLLTNILTEKPDTANTKVQFTDVVDYEWYVPTIKTAVAAGITSGYGDGTFGIGMMISRQEAAKVAGSVIPAAGVEDEKGAETALDKGQIADWAYQYVDLMFKKGYMKGDTEGKFRPTMALTRAEAAAILLNIKKNEPVIAANADELATTDCVAAHQGQAGVFTKGSGTKSDPYEIATEEQLNHMRMHVTEGAFYILKKNIAITKDYAVTPPAIGSDESNWTEGNFVPIGSKEVPFKGSLDGNGYIISGLNITGTVGRSSDKTGASYAGLFGYLGQGSGVSEVIIDASTITGNQYSGAIAGYNEGTVKNCQLGKKGVVTGRTYTGGLIGHSTQPLASMRNEGTIKGSQNYTGGIAGSISAAGTALLYCQNEGDVIGGENTGGIVGKIISAAEAESTIEDCVNKGTVQSESYRAGGIVGIALGSNYNVTINDCTNSGVVTGSGVNGGIAGVLDDKGTSIINSRNTGTVYGNGAGGIAGYNHGIISYSYNSGSVRANMNGGGIAAYQQNGEGRITKCYNEGTVYAKNFAGGITGENSSKIDNCYNSGKVTGISNVGGIAGQNGGTINIVYSAGTVDGDSGVGSLAGKNSGVIKSSFWLESIGTASVGLNENSNGQQLVLMVTKEELSGQIKIKTTDGYYMMIDIMNSSNSAAGNATGKVEPVWEYIYAIVNPASGQETNVISDGGGIVPPIDYNATDMKGNTIKEEDLNTKYLYPCIITKM